jgi:hypothetical protein
MIGREDNDRVVDESLPLERLALRPVAHKQTLDVAVADFGQRIEQQWKGNTIMAWQSFCKALLASSEFIYIN